MLKTHLITIAAVLATATVASPAMAQDDDRQSVTIRYDDLNLTSAAGRERLDTRVRVAIRKMCGTEVRAPMRERVAAAECEAFAKRSIEPQLAALYNGSNARFASEKPPVVAAP